MVGGQDKKPGFKDYAAHAVMGTRKWKRILGVSLSLYAAALAAPVVGSWYSVTTEHAAVVTNEFDGQRTIVEQGFHKKHFWYVPFVSSYLTSVDQHFKGEHIWYFRNPGGFGQLQVRGGQRTGYEDFVQVSSSDFKQTLVRPAVKYKIIDLKTFALTRLGKGLDGEGHDRPYILLGREFDSHIFPVVQSKDQADLLRSGRDGGVKTIEVQDEILVRLKKSDLEKRWGIEVISVLFDAQLTPEVAAANAKKQEEIMLGEGFAERSEQTKTGWQQVIVGGLLGEDPEKTTLRAILEDTPDHLRPGLEKLIDNFIFYNTLKERKSDVIWVPYGSYTLNPGGVTQQQAAPTQNQRRERPSRNNPRGPSPTGP